jgi:5-methylcytosine-specific restriction endonuclease McrA
MLTVAHLNHDPADNRLKNLQALCQRCHLKHDEKHHARRESKAKKQGL